MKIKIAALLIIMFSSFSITSYAQVIENPTGFELKQELNILKKELTQRGEITNQPQNTEQLMQRISELSKELESAQNKVKNLEHELELKSQKQNKTDDSLIDVRFKKKKSKDEQILELTNQVSQLQERISKYQSTSRSSFSDISNSQDYRKQIDSSSNTIVEQTKQLSKAYEEIEKLKKNSVSTEKLVNNLIFQAEKLYYNGKSQEAIVIYEILDKLNVKEPKIYQNLALIYQGLGMNSEANKQYDKLYLLFPNLKGDEKINK
ncbi:MAG: hypothetical protein A2287_10900 [Candidatus Melainabacteria bacterium RIFOXYA12_FULL_32_12]|nr:MAG: hypothetical protein A2104_03420 [Candidatus Melainabacteria bacterium GWF2_32_7]OGI24399.1 MAG: hypothetical protein A2287_10900 [Candidatus Melainabacteria bacterium RIFOXYA12_FULL_32_12]